MHYCVCDYVLDILQNACESGAQLVRLDFVETSDWIRITVDDDGKGMDEATRQRALDPFRSGGAKHPGRKVGLGLPFLQQAVETAHGEWDLRSQPGKGTRVYFAFPKSDTDCPPLGDVPGLFLAALCLPGSQDMEIVRRLPPSAQGYSLRKSELSDALGGLEQVSSLAMLKDFLLSQESDE